MARDLIQVYRGLEINLPNLAQGELGYTTDTKKFFIGGVSGNVEIGRRNVLVLEDYGAVGGGEVDDTQAFKDAFDVFTNGAVGGTLLLLNTKYLITDTLKLPDGVSLVGQGMGGITGLGSEILAKVATWSNKTMIQLGVTGETEMQGQGLFNLKISLPEGASGGDTSIGVDKQSSRFLTLDNVFIEGSSGANNFTGIRWSNGTHNKCSNVKIIRTRKSLHIDCPPGSESHNTVWDGLYLNPKDTGVVGEAKGIFVTGSGGDASAIHFFNGLYIETLGAETVNAIEIVDSGQSFLMSIDGIHFDGQFNYRLYNHIVDTKVIMMGMTQTGFAEDLLSGDRMFNAQKAVIISNASATFKDNFRVVDSSVDDAYLKITTNGVSAVLGTEKPVDFDRSVGSTTGYFIEYINTNGNRVGGLFEKTDGSMMLILKDNAGANFIQLDSDIGDLILSKAGRGINLTTPDGANQYRITIDNAGAIVTTLV